MLQEQNTGLHLLFNIYTDPEIVFHYGLILPQRQGAKPPDFLDKLGKTKNITLQLNDPCLKIRQILT